MRVVVLSLFSGLLLVGCGGAGSAGPTVHTGTISQSETWSKEGNPHIIRSRVQISGESTPIVTLGAGVEVHFETDAYLEVGRGNTGGLIAEGTEEEPIVMRGDSAAAGPGYWKNIALWGGTTPETRLTWVQMSHCGGSDGCVYVYGETSFVVQHVTISDSGAHGVFFDGPGSFGTGSEDLQVKSAAQYAVRIHPEHTGSVPSGSYSGSTLPGVLIREGSLTRNTTWKKLDAPWVIADRVMVRGTTDPTLTIAPGAEVRFKPDAYLEIGRGDPATLIAEGTETEKIRFTADSASPSAGFHKSIDIWGLPQVNKLDHVIIEYADNGVWFSKDPAAILTNSRISHSSSCAVGYYTSATNTVDFEAPLLNNVFEANAGVVCEN